MNKTNLLYNILLIALCLSSCQTRVDGGQLIGYVMSERLVAQYEGMKEAQHLFQQKKLSLTNEIDSLTVRAESIIFSLDSISSQNANGVDKGYVNILQAQFGRVNQRRDELVNQIQLDDEKIMSGVLTQVNAHVSDYAKQNGYSVIFSTMNGNSVLYGAPECDLTDAIVDFMNERY